jgi:hypothetical protein
MSCLSLFVNVQKSESLGHRGRFFTFL